MTDIPAPRVTTSTGNLETLIRNLRLASGLVLMTFVVLHLANHALNLISLETAERGRYFFLSLWRNPLGTSVLASAFLVHVVLAFVSLYRRRTLTMPVREWAQLVLGLAILLLIAEHVIGTRT